MDICRWFCKSTHVHYASTSQFIKSEDSDAFFQDYICPGIDSGTEHAVLDITAVERYTTINSLRSFLRENVTINIKQLFHELHIGHQVFK